MSASNPPRPPRSPQGPEGLSEPQWDAADPYVSVLLYAKYLLQKARWMFLKDKTHAEIVFLFRSEGAAAIMLVPPDVDNKRTEFLSDLRAMMPGSPEIIGVIHIAEAWTRLGTSADHISKQLYYGEMTVSDLRPEDRGEALIVSLQTRNGLKTAWVEPIIRTGDRVSLGEGFTIRQPSGVGNLFG